MYMWLGSVSDCCCLASTQVAERLFFIPFIHAAGFGFDCRHRSPVTACPDALPVLEGGPRKETMETEPVEEKQRYNAGFQLLSHV